MRADADFDVLTAQPPDLAIAEAGLEGQHQESAIPSADPGFDIRSDDESLRLVLGEKRHGPAFETLWRNRENPLTLQTPRRFGERNVPKEAVEGREPLISGARSVAAIAFQMFEEHLKERGIELLEAKR